MVFFIRHLFLYLGKVNFEYEKTLLSVKLEFCYKTSTNRKLNSKNLLS